MRYLLDEEEFRALPTKTEIDELEQRIRECDVLIKLLRDKILTMTNTVCIHVSQQDVSYFCNNSSHEGEKPVEEWRVVSYNRKKLDVSR